MITQKQKISFSSDLISNSFLSLLPSFPNLLVSWNNLQGSRKERMGLGNDVVTDTVIGHLYLELPESRPASESMTLFILFMILK